MASKDMRWHLSRSMKWNPDSSKWYLRDIVKPPPEKTHKEMREELERHVKTFVDNGGSIKTIPQGMTGFTQLTYNRNYPNKRG